MKRLGTAVGGSRPVGDFPREAVALSGAAEAFNVTPFRHDRSMELCCVATEQLEAEFVAHAAWESRGLARFLDLVVDVVATVLGG